MVTDFFFGMTIFPILILEEQMGKFKKNVTIQFLYPHALNLQYFYLHLLLKSVF